MNEITLTNTEGPHANARVLLRGNTTNPKRALLLFHGRGAQAGNILRLADEISLPGDVLVCAPEASGHTWYPDRFVVLRQENEPHLSSALSVVDSLITFCKAQYAIKPGGIVLAGFSQGACLVADYIARNPHTYAGACIFSGGLIGSDDEVEKRAWKGNLKGTPVYIGCDGQDSHIPHERVETTALVLKKSGAEVTLGIYTDLGHAIHPAGIEFLSALLNRR